VTRHGIPASHLRLKRAYEAAAPQDGVRVLVDRLWPRGLSKADAAISRWMKAVAPSTELRQWFGHDPERWQEFRRRYVEELRQNTAVLDELRELALASTITLVFAAHDEAHNDAVVLRDFLLQWSNSEQESPQAGAKETAHGQQNVSTSHS
jgi:uncharacterized protein YeaO (DUF488 family)